MQYLNLVWQTLSQTWQDWSQFFHTSPWNLGHYGALAMVVMLLVLRQGKLLFLLVTGSFYGHGFYKITAKMNLESGQDWGHLFTYTICGAIFFFTLIYWLFIRPEDTKT